MPGHSQTRTRELPSPNLLRFETLHTHQSPRAASASAACSCAVCPTHAVPCLDVLWWLQMSFGRCFRYVHVHDGAASWRAACPGCPNDVMKASRPSMYACLIDPLQLLGLLWQRRRRQSMGKRWLPRRKPEIHQSAICLGSTWDYKSHIPSRSRRRA